MTSVQSGVKEAVERVTGFLDILDDADARHVPFAVASGLSADLRTLLAALSSQAEVMEAMAKGLIVARGDVEEWFECIEGESREAMRHTLNEDLARIDCALSLYRSLNGDA